MLRFGFYICFLGLLHSSFAGPLFLNAESDSDTQEEVSEVTGPAVGSLERSEATLVNWSPPSYDNQDGALGYSATAFRIPPAMQERVKFWMDIYTQYRSSQGLLHDSLYMNLIYEKVDFAEINARVDLTDRQKEKAKKDLLKERKKAIADRLIALEKVTDPQSLVGEDKRYYEMFAKVDEKNKFIEASKKGRLRFQLGQREQFINGIYQSGRYLKQMEEIFRQQGMPIELTRLPFVESSFNIKARSRVGASGIWQFMRTTARYYMRRDSSADERNDPLLATRAAAKKLRQNYQMLEAWPLAVTAYNHGPSGVKRLVQKFGTTDLSELTDVRHRRFGFASANFYASFLAALEVEKNAKQFFGELKVLPELKGVEIQLSKNLAKVEILKYFNGDEAEARLFNPHIDNSVWSGKQQLQRKNILRVPQIMEAQARASLQQSS